MPHLLATVAGHAESAARAESPARRPARDSAATGDDAFAAILDRVSAARGDTARARLGDDGAAVADARDAVTPDAAPRYPISTRATENGAKSQATASQQHQQPARDAHRPDEGTAPQAPAEGDASSASCETCEKAPQSQTPPPPVDPAHQASPVADTTNAAPPLQHVAPAAPVIAIAPPLATPQADLAAAPDLPSAAPMPGPMPLPEMPTDAPPASGPMQPGAPIEPPLPPAQAMPTPSRASADASAEAVAAPTAAPGPLSSPPSPAGGAPTAPIELAQETPAVAVRGDTTPQADDNGEPRTTPIATPATPASAAPARPDVVVTSAPLQAPRERSARGADPTPIAASPTINAPPLVEGTIAQSAAPPGPSSPAGEQAFARALPLSDDATTVATLPIVARGGANADEPSAAARQVASRNAAQPNTALAAQLAQQDAGAQAATPAPAATAGPAMPADAARPAADWLGATRGDVAADEIAPVRHAITLPPEASAAPSRVDAAQETAAARTARMPMHPAIAQVAVSVTKAVQEGVDRITIKLQPPELGRIDVRIEVGVDGRLQAVFAAERQATVEILQRDVRELERALQNAGLSTDSGSLSFGLKQNGGQNANAFAAFQRDHGTGHGTQGEDDVPPVPRPMRAAADGRLDIHV